MTKTYRAWFWVLLAVSVILNVGPLATYTIIAFVSATAVTQKVTLTMFLLVVLILSVISWVNKITLRSRLWILLVGIYIALDYILLPVIIIACCQVVDEVIVCPFKNMCARRLEINKMMDKRLG